MIKEDEVILFSGQVQHHSSGVTKRCSYEAINDSIENGKFFEVDKFTIQAENVTITKMYFLLTS